MLAIDVRDCHLTVSTPHIGVSRASWLLSGKRESRSVGSSRGAMIGGTFRLAVSDSPELAVRILEGIGCQVTRAPNDWIGIHITPRANGYATTDAGRSL
jgi:hypothetical protein